MNKATFVSEIPSKIEGNEVPTLNLVNNMLTSENISDRITEYLSQNQGTHKWSGPNDSKLTSSANFLYFRGSDESPSYGITVEYNGEILTYNETIFDSYQKK